MFSLLSDDVLWFVMLGDKPDKRAWVTDIARFQRGATQWEIIVHPER